MYCKLERLFGQEKVLQYNLQNCSAVGGQVLLESVAIQILYCRQLVGEIILQCIILYCSKRGWQGKKLGHNTILYRDLGEAVGWREGRVTIQLLYRD